MINPHLISDFIGVVKKLILKTEGPPLLQPTLIKAKAGGSDHTITYGYGYTFIRKDSKGGTRGRWCTDNFLKNKER